MNILGIGSKWNILLDATLSLSIRMVSRTTSELTIAFTPELVAARIPIKAIASSMRMSAIQSVGL